MKRTYRFVQSIGTVQCTMGPDREVTLPVFPGILKHPTVDELRDLLMKPAVARKYTYLVGGWCQTPILLRLEISHHLHGCHLPQVST